MAFSNTGKRMSGGSTFTEWGWQEKMQNSLLEEEVKRQQLKNALSKVKNEGKQQSYNGSSSGSDSALTDALSKLGAQLAGSGANNTNTTSLSEEERLKMGIEGNSRLQGERSNQELEAIKLKAKLDAERKQTSLSSALSSLGRFRGGF